MLSLQEYNSLKSARFMLWDLYRKIPTGNNFQEIHERLRLLMEIRYDLDTIEQQISVIDDLIVCTAKDFNQEPLKGRIFIDERVLN